MTKMTEKDRQEILSSAYRKRVVKQGEVWRDADKVKRTTPVSVDLVDLDNESPEIK